MRCDLHRFDKVLLRESGSGGRNRFRVADLHMHFGHSFHEYKAANGLSYDVSYCEKAMITKDNGPVVCELSGDSFACGDTLDLDFIIVRDGVILKEYTGFLGDRFNGSHLTGEGCAPARVNVRCTYQFRSGIEDRLMNIIACHVCGTVTFDG